MNLDKKNIETSPAFSHLSDVGLRRVLSDEEFADNKSAKFLREVLENRPRFRFALSSTIQVLLIGFTVLLTVIIVRLAWHMSFNAVVRWWHRRRGFHPPRPMLRPTVGSLMEQLEAPPASYAEAIYRRVAPYLAARGLGAAGVAAGCARCQACSAMSLLEGSGDRGERTVLPLVGNA
jgi:hypothetical protein